jgi:hypothetical protein
MEQTSGMLATSRSLIQPLLHLLQTAFTTSLGSGMVISLPPALLLQRPEVLALMYPLWPEMLTASRVVVADNAWRCHYEIVHLGRLSAFGWQLPRLCPIDFPWPRLSNQPW